MNIEEAKRSLEQKIIIWDGVRGLGVVEKNAAPVIEVAFDDDNAALKEKLNELLTNGQWQGHKVELVPADGFKFH